MRTTKLLAATAILSAMVATPVLAQDLTPRSSIHQGAYDSDGMQNTRTRMKMKKQVRYNENERGMRAGDNYNRDRRSDSWDRDDGWDTSWNNNDNWNRRDTGFWPGDVATGIVGGAVGTAGAIASGAVGTAGAVAGAPFRNTYASSDSYAYGSYGGGYSRSDYMARNGFVCEPGTIIRAQNGERQICQ